MGDAVNWEWIVHCAEDSGKDIIIVTRDTDYGVSYGEKFFLNDWLLLEFKERISQRRKIVLMDRLARAFKLVEIRVSAKAEQEEKDLVAELSAKLPSLKCEAAAIVQPSASADALQPARG
ncbi:MAG: hypothetical protein ACREYE_19240 [Gammaproteobacteria bacterium]